MAFLFSPEGRISRSDYWLWFVGPFVGAAIFMIVFGQVSGEKKLAETLFLIVAVLFFVCHIPVSIKRLHDCRLSAWWAIPVNAAIALGVLVLAYPPVFEVLSAVPDMPAARAAASTALATLVVTSIASTAWVWAKEGTDGRNRYGNDPLYR